MARIFEHFVVPGLGPEIRTLDGNKGFHGTGVLNMPSLLDQYPPPNYSLYAPPPPQLPTCVLPTGVEFYTSGFDSNDVSTFPRSYPIVLTVAEIINEWQGVPTSEDQENSKNARRLWLLGVS
ncbi:hypothetical protein F0562_025231 [Nyssa sinensis]|uniref:uDENN domain-containing protein n=1 Tax=Nyssa sinensis TaxID=561372 RepID=A0A5J5BF47_9ASTE|nr:hypothetical protein F0562_025231 [Nyssa sinensis]